MARLVPLQPGPEQRLGRSVTAEGKLVVAGAPGDPYAGPEAGSATLWELEGGNWREEARLTAPDPERGDRFGTALASSGQLVVVGAPGRRHGAERSGAAHVFLWCRKRVVLEATLTPHREPTWGAFGAAVGIDGNLALVGAPGQDAADPGGAYAFRWTGRDWVQEARLGAPSARGGERVGAAVALRGSTALVAAPGSGEPPVPVLARGSGAVHVFVRGRTGWSHAARLEPEGRRDERFGASVALAPGVAAVGAPGVRQRGAEGRVYVFRHVAQRWYREAVLDAPRGALGFGASVAIEGDQLLVGATRPAHGDPPGAAFHYARTGGTWVLRSKLTGDDTPEGDGFGHSVALSPAGAVVGAPREEGERGAVFVLALATTPVVVEPVEQPIAEPVSETEEPVEEEPAVGTVEEPPPADEPAEGTVTPVVVTGAPATAPASTPVARMTGEVFLSVVGQGGTLYPGDAAQAEHVGKLVGHDYGSAFEREQASGPGGSHASGSFRPRAVAFTIRWSSAAPLFVAALSENHVLPEVVIEFVGEADSGERLIARVVRLADARVARAESRMDAGGLTQRIELLYQSLTVESGSAEAVVEAPAHA